LSALFEQIRVLAVDDHPLMRDGIAALIATSKDITLVGEASTGLEAIERVRELQPDVTLMDMRMPGMCGIDAIQMIRREFADARIIVLTTFPGDVLAQRALKAGAQGYLLKSEVRTDLIDTIRAVRTGMRPVDPEIAQQLAENIFEEPLSQREITVLELAAHGNANKVIARELNVAEGTIKIHMQHILSKLRASDRTHAVALALRRGIIGLGSTPRAAQLSPSQRGSRQMRIP
jgi:DNA-binding NarL/FixJ family response regulator